MGKTILLADDSVTIQKVVELTFMDEDYQVVAVGSGSEALDRLATVAPDLLIADVHMPGADGYEVCRRCKEQRPGVPVLLLVGTFEPFDADEAAACGADGHLKKPFDSQELLRRVEELLAGAGEAAPQPAAGPTAADEPTGWDDHDDRKPSWEEMRAADEAGDEAYALDVDSPAGEEPAPVELPPADELELEPSPWTAAKEGADELGETVRSEAIRLPSAEAAAAGEAPRAAPAPEPPAPSAPGFAEGATAGPLSDEDVDRIARRVVELLGEQTVREVAWEVVPDMAEVVIKDRIRELERQLEA